MNERERQAILDYFACAALEATEDLREALDNLRAELLKEDE